MCNNARFTVVPSGSQHSKLKLATAIGRQGNKFLIAAEFYNKSPADGRFAGNLNFFS